MKTSQLVTRLEERFDEPLQEMGYALRDVEWVREHNDWYLRFFIQKPDGITLTDCEQVSRYLDGVLDDEFTFGDEGYILEVSSPGLEAPLKKPAHWDEALGQPIEVSLYQKLDGQKTIRGILKELNTEHIVLDTGEQTVRIQRQQIAKANLAIAF